jgi:DNA-binding NarL/FixJ family response regulator
VSKDTSALQPDHIYLLQTLSAMQAQLHALQSLVREDPAGGEVVLAGPPDMTTIRNGLASLEQLTTEMLEEVRAASDDLPLDVLPAATLAESLAQAVDETAETLGLSSRVVFSGEERPLAVEDERLLYRLAREALEHIRQHSGARRLRFTFNYGRDEVTMSIEDDGFPAEQPPLSIFNEAATLAPPFATATGAGFSNDEMVWASLRRRIEHLGGSLQVVSNIEQGTQVQTRLPYVHHTHKEAATVSDSKEQLSLQPFTAVPEESLGNAAARIRILLVDSQTVTRAGLRRLLESYPDLVVVGEAADGVQAVSETAELAPQVVILDAQLPNGQSLEALRQIKQFNPDIHILFLSTLDREEYLYEALRAGASGYVLKDIAPDELAQAIRSVARGEVLVQPQLAGRLISRFGKQARSGYPQEMLTAREQEVLRLLARGLRNKEIAARLVVSERTVNFHLANIYQKLNVSGRTEALSKAHEQGLIPA